MQPRPAQRAYWQRNIRLTVALLCVWFLSTFVAGYFADELNHFTLLGFPVGFYLFAQGSLLIYLVIIGVYVSYMNRLDRDWVRESAPGEPRTRFPSSGE